MSYLYFNSLKIYLYRVKITSSLEYYNLAANQLVRLYLQDLNIKEYIKLGARPTKIKVPIEYFRPTRLV